MLVVFSGLVGACGLISLLSKRTLMGALTGVQLLFLGTAMMFVSSGGHENMGVEAHVFAILITFVGVSFLVTGYALAVRLYYLKKRIYLSDLRQLKH